MRKYIMLLMVLVCIATNAAAIGLGGGFKMSPYWRNFRYNGYIVDITQKNQFTDWGIYAFADIKYMQAEFGYAAFMTGSTNLGDFTFKKSYLDFGLYLKYPIPLGIININPMIGINYKHCVAYKDNHGNDIMPDDSAERKDLNQFWLKGGAGIDIRLGKLHIRPTVLIGYRFKSQYIRDLIELSDDSGVSIKVISPGLDFSVSAGYYF